MRPRLTAIRQNFLAPCFTLSTVACLLASEAPASAAEPLVIHGSDTFTFEIVANRPGCPQTTSVSTSDSGSGQ